MQHFEDEMKVLRNKTEIRYSLDLDRLKQAITRLQISLKLIKTNCARDDVQLLREAAQEIIKTMEMSKLLETAKVSNYHLEATFAEV